MQPKKMFWRRYFTNIKTSGESNLYCFVSAESSGFDPRRLFELFVHVSFTTAILNTDKAIHI